jgi:malate dehydrogenase (oxaloacetate-decarboxylating)
VENLIVVVKDLPDIKLLEVRDRTFEIHKGGKIQIQSKLPLKGQDDLAMAYTPGVGRVCMAIADDKSKVL